MSESGMVVRVLEGSPSVRTIEGSFLPATIFSGPQCYRMAFIYYNVAQVAPIMHKVHKARVIVFFQIL
jgi:hypothetical protein